MSKKMVANMDEEGNIFIGSGVVGDVCYTFTVESIIEMHEERNTLQEENRHLRIDANYNNPNRWLDEYVAIITDKTFTVSKMSDSAKGELKAMLLGQSQAYGDVIATLRKFIGDNV